jgi:allantoinase
MWEADERRLIVEATETIQRQEGRRPKGWLGPWLAETWTTPDLLKEAGYRCVLDWSCGDQPFWMRTRAGPPFASDLRQLHHEDPRNVHAALRANVSSGPATW